MNWCQEIQKMVIDEWKECVVVAGLFGMIRKWSEELGSPMMWCGLC